MKTKPRILVTTAAGNTGKATTIALLEKGYPVRAFVRRRDHRSKVLEDAGAEIFVGDMANLLDVRQALTDVQRAYVCMPLSPHGLHDVMTFAVAASEARLEALVWMSQWLSAAEHPSLATRETYLIDHILKWIPGAKVATVNPGWFADNYFLVMEPMAQLGIMPLPLGNGGNAPPSSEDMGRVIAEILADPGSHHGKTYRPTGPKVLSPEDIASSIGNALGRRVKYVDVPEKMLLKSMKSQGYGQFFQMDLLRYYTEDYRQNAFAVGAPTNVVEEITKRPAEDFDTIARRYVVEMSKASARRYAVELPEARQSFGNKVKAMQNFAKILLTKAPNIEALERALEVPKLSTSRYGSENQDWLNSHDVDNAYGVPKWDLASALLK